MTHYTYPQHTNPKHPKQTYLYKKALLYPRIL